MIELNYYQILMIAGVALLVLAAGIRFRYWSEFTHRRYMRRVVNSDEFHRSMMGKQIVDPKNQHKSYDHDSPWHPMTNPIDIKHLGKLGEEANELGGVSARCLIQGIDEINPDTGVVNRIWLENEIADVMANSELNIQHFKLDRTRIEERKSAKIARLRKWHKGA